MKKFITVICIVSAAFAAFSFNTKSNGATQTPSDIIDYMEAHHMESISKQELASIASASPAPDGSNYDEYCTNCSEITYCGMDSTDLIQYIDNYRDSVWSKTSPHFDTNPYDPAILFEGNNYEDEFDARFMDMDIEKLENYICAIKNSTIGDEVNTIRFYYIRYDESSAPFPNFEWKHSIAMVPVKVNENGLTTEEYIQQLVRKDGTFFSLAVDVNNFCANTAVANHGNLCPPFTGCHENTLLEVADTN